MSSCYTYILLCDNGQFYVGSTDNLERRLQEHQKGIGANFTKAHLAVKLVISGGIQNNRRSLQTGKTTPKMES